jgi:hypothetical protein
VTGIPVVAFCGEQGAGKDTACAGMRLLDFKQLAFADPLRTICGVVFGLSAEEMTDRDLKEKPIARWPFMSPRQILKLVGTEGFRDNFPGVWIQALIRTSRDHTRLTVSDARFQDEADAIKAMGGILVRIDNPRVEPKKDPHRSEIEWRDFDYDAVIVNDCDGPGAFQLKVVHWWQEYSKLRAPA